MRGTSNRIERPYQLIVEGEDDLRFWEQYLPRVGRPRVEIRETGGRDQLRRFLTAFTRTTGFDQVEWIGIVQDADHDARAAFDRIRGALAHAQLPTPRRAWIPVGSSPNVVAIVLPDGTNQGDLEALLWEGLQHLQEADCIDEYVKCVERVRSQPLTRRSKSLVYAYVATLDRPDTRLSHAILQGHVASPGLSRLLDLIPK
jgi:hypothetical protein